MNKKEWKLQHAANRRMYHGLFAPMSDGERSATESANFTVASKLFWKMIGEMHYSFKYAMQKNQNVSYPIKEERWAISHNSKCFNEHKKYN